MGDGPWGMERPATAGTRRFSTADHRSDVWLQEIGLMDILSILDEIGPPCTGLKARLGLSSRRIRIADGERFDAHAAHSQIKIACLPGG